MSTTHDDDEAEMRTASHEVRSAVGDGAIALEQQGSPAEWEPAERVYARPIDILSVSSLYLKLWSETKQPLGTATAFVVHYKRRLFLVTNWHVLSGRNAITEQPCHSSMALPHQVRIAHHNGARLGAWQFVGERLSGDNGEPRWIEHPRGRTVDVAVLELTKVPPAATMYAFNLELEHVELPTPPGTPVSVIGFPLGLRENEFFAIWKTGHIASDVEIRGYDSAFDRPRARALSKLPGRRARKPLPARKARRTAPRGNGPTIDERLAWIVADARAGKHVECSWEIFRLQHFPGWPHERVAAALGLWSTRQGIRVRFEARDVEAAGAIIPAICVCFASRA